MSKPSQIDSAKIRNKAELIAWFEAGCAPAKNLLIGVEHEKPPFYLDNNDPVPYQGCENRAGIKEFFEKMALEDDWRPGYELANIIALQKDRVNWTLEPGGQLETGGAPLKDVHQIARETDDTIQEAVQVAKGLGIGLLALGYHPTHSGKDMPFMPKSRNRTFREYVERKKFAHGLDGMFCTSTVQVNLNYESEADMVKMLRVALSLQPVVVSLFANSPFKEGQPSGYQSYRSHVIHNYMGGRYGFMLPVAFEKDFGFEKFVDYALNEMPLIGIYKDNAFIDAKGGKFGDFMAGKLEVDPGHKATLADWENHLNTIWPEVRLRRFLEMRGADNGPAEMIKALPAFWTGLLYDKQSLDAAYELVRPWTNEDREYLRAMTPLKGLQTPFMNGATSVQKLAKQCIDLAEAGLKRRGIINADGDDESVYLRPLHEIADSGRNWAQRLLDLYQNAWNGDMNRLFENQNYENEPSVLTQQAGKYVLEKETGGRAAAAA
ncbi:MAG: glutamate--cysteine ligase [Alphaproteobacteria bacterium]|nr:glutamate--cysteine ligase [Alphaproteobacteria bacterium]